LENLWIALSWSAAVLPAWLIVQAFGERLAAQPTWVQAAAFVAAWLVCGRVLASITRIVLIALGVPVDDDPRAVLRRTQRRLESGTLAADEAHLRMAACRIALGEFDAALIDCDRADEGGALRSRAGQSRFLRARALEGAGKRDDAAARYRALAADAVVPRVHRAAARIRLYGLEAAGGAAAEALPADLTNLLGAAGDAGAVDDDELEFYADALTDVCRSAGAPAAAGVRAALDLLERRAKSGRTQRAIRRMRAGLPNAPADRPG
jgi:hypothetical protein